MKRDVLIFQVCHAIPQVLESQLSILILSAARSLRSTAPAKTPGVVHLHTRSGGFTFSLQCGQESMAAGGHWWHDLLRGLMVTVNLSKKSEADPNASVLKCHSAL